MSPTKFPSVLFMTAGFSFFLAVVALTTLWGDPKNSLHTSAQAWAFVGAFGVLAAFGATSIVELWAKKPNI